MNRWLSICLVLSTSAVASGQSENWYTPSFWLLHEDHHTVGDAEVGRDADLAGTSRLLGLCKPDVIQIHAKGNPGWTTYPSAIGHTPPRLARDVLAIWRDVARRDGYHFSVYYNIGRDGEIMKRRPAWNRIGADGRLVDRALCYHSGVAEEYLWPMIREIIEGYQPDGFWFDGSCFTVRVCYCDVCRKRFQSETGLEAPKAAGEPGWDRYKEMQRQIYREFVHGTAEFIHRLDPDCLVAVNWAYSIRMPEKPDPGVAYLTGDIGNRVEGLSAEAHWYDSLDLPFDLMTQVNTLQRVGDSDDETATRLVMAPKPAEQIQQEMAIIVANGGRYFAWDSPTRESRLTPERFAFLGEVVEPFLRQRRPWCLGSKRVPDVSVLYGAAAHYAVNDSASTCFTKNDNRLEGAADWLARLHLNYEILPDWRLEAGDVRSPLLIVEHPKRLTSASVEALVCFVRGGGRLLITGMGPHRDSALRELVGIQDCIGPAAAEPLGVTIDAEQVSFQHWLFRTGTTTAQTVLETRDANGTAYPLLTCNSAGKGLAFYFATPLLTAHGKNSIPKSLMTRIFESVLPARKRRLTIEAPETVEVVLRQLDRCHVVHLVNMAPGKREVVTANNRRYTKITELPSVPPCRVSLRLESRPDSVRLEPQGKVMERWEYRDGWLEVEVPSFQIHQMVIAENRAEIRIAPAR